ncbi:putative GATA transcription factor 13 [Cardamine amara subsp. amara]|uniref:GATA transcription factor 13 n=1 Tax=Cardamine amara subsp. amara TaxID=228776 RepID=A0ABD1C312_CARAN
MNNNDSWLPDEDFKDLTASFFDDLIDHMDEFPLEDIETVNDEQDWGAEFKNLVPPPLDVLSSLTSPAFTGNGQHARVQNYVPIVKESTSLEASSTIDNSSPDVKVTKLFQSSSPVSVLENTNGSASSQNRAQILTFPIKGVRSKRKHPSLLRLTILHSFASVMAQQFVNAPYESDSEDIYLPSENAAKKKRKKNKNQSFTFSLASDNPEVINSDGTVRTCSHCETTRTPQWREGPNGPKTLCNACGVRFRSGRLLPEYRPASSPTFIPSVHSNSHRKIVEMRRKEEGQFTRKIRMTTSRG